MEIHKLRVKIGPHEFEAEGSEPSVQEQFQSFKDLISTVQAAPPASSQTSELSSDTTKDESDTVDENSNNLQRKLSILFDHDAKRGLVTLRILRSGKERNAESFLLVIYGYYLLRNEEEVPVTKLKASLTQSGIGIDRLTKPATQYVNSKMILKIGKAKGGKYRLTNTGRAEAKKLLEETLRDSD